MKTTSLNHGGLSCQRLLACAMPARKPPYLTRLQVQNFRSLSSMDLRLRALNVLVGPNAAGKSNVLDVLGFLGDVVRGDLAPAIVKRGGWNRVKYRGSAAGPVDHVTIEVHAAVTRNSSSNALDEYYLSIRPIGRPRSTKSGANPDRGFFRYENFMFKRTAGPGRRITIEGSGFVVADERGERTGHLREGSLGLATLPRLGPDEGGQQVEALADLFASFRVFDPDVAAIRRPSEQVRGSRLDDDGSNLAAFLLYLAEEHPGVFERLQRDACLFVPGLQELVLETYGGSRLTTVMRLREQGLEGLTDLADASYGSLRALALLAVLYDPHPPKLTCIEELDHGLHPYVLDRLVELLRQASQTSQLIVATHSPALVNRLRSMELVVCEKGNDGASRIPAVSPDIVRQMEHDLHGALGLGELWFTGALGGVPDL